MKPEMSTAVMTDLLSKEGMTAAMKDAAFLGRTLVDGEIVTEYQRIALCNVVSALVDLVNETSARREAAEKPVVPQTLLRELVDVVWQDAKESTEVPDTEWADELIGKVFPAAQALPVVPDERAAGQPYTLRSATFDEIRDTIAEMTGGIPVTWREGLKKGHHEVPFMNFNSLGRIVDKFRASTFNHEGDLLIQPYLVPDEAFYEKREEKRRDGTLNPIGVTTSVGWNACRDAMLQPGNSEQANVPTVSFYRDGIVAAAQLVEKKREVYDSEHGLHDPDTGTFEFGNDAQLEYSETLRDIEEGIRALHPNAIANSPVIPEGWALVPVTADAEMVDAAIVCGVTRGMDGALYVKYDDIYAAMIAAAPQLERKDGEA
ncbi:hypothetical protein IG608_09140 [Pectobacterium sp. A113-S21-F16]|uniref:hypothetical protein n=1 Tax=Pectobacterium quasiaquaticum TaxID=2774015 RepID=UPI0018752B0B|nr:hypothetical protein [Pectobacterium quasiaquaticum]MBE5221629.1 hypothetical protein [Pectobacterium quasiaquaticum]